MRIAVIKKERCKPKKCDFLCQRVCPRVMMGDAAIEVGTDGLPIINEDLCIGCGICTNKCPFNALAIVNLPEELENPIHQFGKNGFRLYKFPLPQKNSILGLLGENGTGKSTALRILSGELKPSIGASWEDVIKFFKGSALHEYFSEIAGNKLKVSHKPQKLELDLDGKVGELLKKVDKREIGEKIIKALEIEETLQKSLKELSGGELQRVAIAACLSKDADVYIFDEPASFLDVRQRLNVARVIKNFTAEKYCIFVEHDLVFLDFLADDINIFYGKNGVYGIVSGLKNTRRGINDYLDGFLPEENVRFRQSLKFQLGEARDTKEGESLIEFSTLKKSLGKFKLEIKEGKIQTEEIIGVVGPNATGKSTFMNILAGILKPDEGSIRNEVKISYKPQHISIKEDITVGAYLVKAKPELVEKLGIKHLLSRQLSELSGGELQRVEIAHCLSEDADLYLLDEPSAYLDVEQRLELIRILRSFIKDNDKSAFVVDHDLMFLNYLSERILLFSGISGISGSAEFVSRKDGMNLFLKRVGVTMRADKDTRRPKVNKPDSQKDKEQREKGAYYEE